MTPSLTMNSRATVAPMLSGRDPERAAIDRHLQETKAERGSVLLVEGRSGLGKSRLLHEATACAEVEGFRVGAAVASPGSLPMAPLLTALFGGAEPLLHQPLPDMTSVAPSFWSVSRLSDELERTVRQSPVLVCIDDIHVADPDTSAAVAILVHRLRDLPVLWMLSYGPGVDRTVSDLIATLDRHGAETLVLAPLGGTAIARLTADLLGAEPSSELLAMTALAGGVPSSVVDLLRGLVEEGSLRVDDGRAQLIEWRLPRRAVEAARAAVGRATARAREVAVVAAVLGTPVSLGHLAAMLAVPAASLLAPIEELIHADVLDDDGRSLAFRGELVRRAFTEQVAPSVSRALRLQAIEVLLDAGASPIEPARELVAMGRPNDRAAVATLASASLAVAPTNPELAAQLSRRALDATAAGDERRPSLAADLGQFLHDSGQGDEGRAVIEAMADEPLSDEEEARLRLTLARMVDLPPTVRIEAGERALAIVGVARSRRAEHAAELVVNHIERGDVQCVAALLPDAEAAVAAAGDPGAAGLLGIAQAALTAHEGGLERARADLEALRTPPAREPRSSTRRGGFLHAELLLALDDIDVLEPLVASAIARAHGDLQVSLGRSWRRFHGRLLVQRGRLAEADIVLAGELDEHVVAATPELARLALTVGEVALRTGDDRRSRLVAGIATGAPDDGGPTVRCLATWLLAVQAEAANDRSAARERLVQLGPEREVARLPLLLAEPSIAPRLVRMAMWVGLDAIAVAAATAAVDLARRNPGTRTTAAAAAHSRGLVDRDPNALAQAAELYGRTSLVLAEASAREDHGIELARRTERSAVDAFDGALRHYVRCGASWDASRVRKRLRALGVRRRLVVPTRPTNGWGSLTTAELAVVRLVAEGLTNRAVARQLFLSSHTVSMHLRHVFLKLGINSRVELARLVLDHEHV